MNVLEAIQANPVFSGIPESYIQSIMTSRSIDGFAGYSESSLKDVELTSADLYQFVAISPKFKEGDLSIDYDISQLLARARALYSKYGDDRLQELLPQNQTINVGVSDASDAW